MCGRYSFDAEIDTLISAWKLRQQKIEFEKNPEIRPTNGAPVLFSDGQLRLVRWGFQPSFAKQPFINARGETVTEKPTFKEAFRRRRCILPATGFYEWKEVGKPRKEKHLFQTSDPFLAMAGLWDIFLVDGEKRPCFTIITTAATEQMDGIHDRMPVLLNPEDRLHYLNHQTFTEDDWKRILLQQDTRLSHGAVA